MTLTVHRVTPDDWRSHRDLRLEMLQATPDAFFTQYFGRGVITAIPNPDTGFVDFASVNIVGNTTDVCAALSP